MSDESFITTEYTSCFEQMRYYDTRQWEIVQYLVTLATAAAGAQFAVYSLFVNTTSSFELPVGFFATQMILSLVVFVGSLLLYIMMLQNRIYFVYVARQVNAIRKYELVEDNKFSNQLYTSVSFSAYKPLSVHTMQMLGAVFISSLFAGTFAYGLLRLYENPSALSISSWAVMGIFVIEIFIGMSYLSSVTKKTADEAIHMEFKEIKKEV